MKNVMLLQQIQLIQLNATKRLVAEQVSEIRTMIFQSMEKYENDPAKALERISRLVTGLLDELNGREV